jgi:hypothetical protein
MKTNFSNRARRAFTLLEVMIAAAMFFLAVFACRLQRPQVDASAVLALFVSTNQLVEGTYSGNLSDSLGDAYRDYNWTAEITEVATNKLFSIECIVQANGKQEIVSDMTTLFYRPKSVAGSMDGGNFIHK